MTPNMLILFFWILLSGTLSSTWSSNINSLFKQRSVFQFAGGMSPSLVESIASGAQMAMDHCQTAFKWERWNCPQSTFSRKAKQQPTKETAFTKAIISAGIIHAITKNCSSGGIKACGCDPRREGPLPEPEEKYFNPKLLDKQEVRWSWGGCSDEPSYAMSVAEKFLDGLEKGNDAQALIAKHNNKVGRQIIKNSMIKKCRCHGVSGSCTLQTCWMQLAPFEEITAKLRESYNKAVKISFEHEEGSLSLGNSARSFSKGRKIPVEENQLVFLEHSPDYCVVNSTSDWPGTKGRICTRSYSDGISLAEKKSCRNLCRSCGHRVKKLKKRVAKRCNCAFSWCCEVKCETCIENVDEFFCD